MLQQSSHPSSKFDVALIGPCPPFSTDLSVDILSEVQRVLKPTGKVLIRSSSPKILSNLKLAGFSSVTEENVNLTDEEKAKVVPGIVLKEIKASKPDFEVGSSMPLSFAKAKKSVEDMDDPDDLLSEEDKVKPDAASLKVCRMHNFMNFHHLQKSLCA